MDASRRVDHRRICFSVAIAVACLSAASAIFLQFVIASPDLTHRLGETLLPELILSLRVCGVTAAVASGFALWVRRRPMVRPAITGTLHLLLVLFVFWWADRVVGLWFPPPPPDVSLLAPHPVRGWCLKPGMHGRESGVLMRTDDLGLRGPALAKLPAPGEFRILFLGDSIIFGFGVPEEDGIVPQTQAAIIKNSPSQRVVCINAGVSGYATWQERSYLEDEGFALEPKLVVLGLSLQNDVSDEVLTRPGEFRGSPIAFEFSNTSHSSGIVRAVASIRAKRAWNARADKIRWQANPEREALFRNHGSFRAVFTEPMMEEFRAARDRVLAELTRIADYCAERRIPFVLIVFSPRERAEADMDSIRPEQAFAEWAAGRGVPMLDAHAALTEHCKKTGENLRSLYLDESHFTSRGCALIAADIAAFLEHERLLSDKSPRPTSAPVR